MYQCNYCNIREMFLKNIFIIIIIKYVIQHSDYSHLKTIILICHKKISENLTEQL